VKCNGIVKEVEVFPSINPSLILDPERERPNISLKKGETLARCFPLK
jgi:hypothetical protein